MSTTLYLQCLEHDPVLQSSNEVGYHLVPDLDNLRSVLARREEMVARYNKWYEAPWGEDEWYDALNRYTQNALSFLKWHPNCKIGIIDEYKREHPLIKEKTS